MPVYRTRFKYLAIFVIAAIILASPGQLIAASTGVEADHRLSLQVNLDGSGSLRYRLEINNNSRSRIVDRVTVTIPWQEVQQPKFNYGGKILKARTRKVATASVIIADLGVESIQPQQKRTLIFTVRIPKMVDTRFGLYQLYLPELGADLAMRSYRMDVKIPEGFPPLSFISDRTIPKDQTNIQFGKSDNYLLVWGHKLTLNIAEEIRLRSDNKDNNTILVNLPFEDGRQIVNYQRISGVDIGLEDGVRNRWLALTPSAQVMYEISIERGLTKQVERKSFTGLEISQLEKFDRVKSINEVYQFMTSHFEPNLAPIERGRIERVKLISLLDSAGAKLTEVEYAALTSALLTRINIPNRIVYGYLIGDYYPRYNPSSPHVWVEYLSSGEVLAMDPFLADVTGYRLNGFQDLMRVIYGVWNTDHEYDSLLGLLSGGVRFRPQLLDFNRAEVDEDYELSLSSIPGRVESGRQYALELLITNESSSWKSIEQIWLDGREVNLASEDKFRYASVPFVSSRVSIPVVGENNILFQGAKKHIVDLQLGERTLSAQVEVPHEVRRQIYLIGLGASLVSILALVLTLSFLLFPRKLEALTNVLQDKNEGLRVHRLPN